ncbi:hypothetical protein GCM10019016_041430 [Streptomyces prasinosporus]|uniref:Uncharacterized protein n=1 Tax=Streptomyces prasinosporus TaxID=68256 RepID=A0ABP6TPU8_9ACTN
MRSVERMGTRPDTPSTMRISWGAPSRGGMKSVTRTVPLSGVPLGFQDQGVAPVVPPGRRGRLRVVGRAPGTQPPEAVFLGSQQPGEDGVRVEARQAQPVDRAVPADQRCGLHVSDECVIFDAPGHVHLQSNGHVTPRGGCR